jgi:hypothetical protein
MTLSNSQISVSGTPNTTVVTWNLNAAAPSQGLVVPVTAIGDNGNPSSFVTVQSPVNVPGGATSFQVTATAASPGSGYLHAIGGQQLQYIKVVP